jgi:pimeloyl-ACP methyl ester carboxylesterase
MDAGVMTTTIPGFEYSRRKLGTGVALNVAAAGSGPPVCLLHGFPQTHLAWRHVAVNLAGDYHVICPDLRGYGDSDKPADDDSHTVYAKRAMANDIVELLGQLGHSRFAVIGHDRGAGVAFRAALDHPEVVTHAGFVDVVPSLDLMPLVSGALAAGLFQLYFMAAPAPIPETMIAAVPEVFVTHFLNAWTTNPSAVPDAVRRAYLSAFTAPQAIAAVCADYRAGVTTDLAHDAADRAANRQLTMATTAIWTSGWPFDPKQIWQAWSSDIEGIVIDGGHLLPEDRPAEVIAAIRGLLTR